MNTSTCIKKMPQITIVQLLLLAAICFGAKRGVKIILNWSAHQKKRLWWLYSLHVEVLHISTLLSNSVSFNASSLKGVNLVTRFLCHFLSLPQTSWSGIPGWWLREYRILRTRKFPTMSRFHQAGCGFFPHFSDTNRCWYCTVLVPRLSGVQLQAIQKQKQCSFSNQPHQIHKRWHQNRTSPEIYETEIVYDEVECAQSKYAVM